MADPCPAPLSFRPPALISRDEEFDERLFDQISVPPASGNGDGEEDGPPAEEERPPAREGLPAGFRMRADAHYVEQIVSRRFAEPALLIPVGEIDGPHPGADGNLEALVRSVARFGILQPLIVRRHESRYELISGLRRLAAAVAAGLADVPCFVYSADEAKARELAEAANLASQEQPPAPHVSPLPESAFTEITEQLGAIDACLHLFAERERPTRERVGIALIRTEVRRAAWLTQALAALSSEAPPALRPFDAARCLGRVVSALGTDRSVTGVAIEAAGDGECPVRADEHLLAIAIAGMIESAQAAAERCPGARVLCSASMDAGRVAVEVALDGAEWSGPLRAAFLDVQSGERPGGTRAAIGIRAAARIAALHGGAFCATDAAGPARLVLSLPSA